MNREVFDVIETIYAQAAVHYQDTGRVPLVVSLSRGSYRRLLEIRVDELTQAGQKTDWCDAIRRLVTPTGPIQVYIDELLNDTEIEIE
jgi:hypothetical protein